MPGYGVKILFLVFLSILLSFGTPFFDLFLIILEVSCPIPKAIPNGFITFAVMRPHGYKEKVKYGCNEHYVLDGDAEIHCQNTGNWSSKPVCRGESAHFQRLNIMTSILYVISML